MFWRRKKLNCKNYHFEELCFSKVSNVRNISASFRNPHLLLILIKQYLTFMVRNGTVKIYSHYDDSASCPETPLQLIQFGCSKSVCKTSRCKCKANNLYRTDLCCLEQKGTHVKIVPVTNMLMAFEQLFSCGFRHFVSRINKK